MIRRVGIVAKQGLTQAAGDLRQLVEWLQARGVDAVLERETAMLAGLPAGEAPGRDDLPRRIDLLVVLGGDGTLLGMAGRIAQAGVPVPILGVNFGRLGFLTEMTVGELQPALDAAFAGRAQLQERLMLQARILRVGRELASRIVLNDVVITKGALSRVVDLRVHVGDSFVTRVSADGLIVATPTGSTAYNLAAAGPIVHPDVEGIVLTPIAPHTLANRPVVIPTASRITIEPADAGVREVFVTFDGQSGLDLQPGDLVEVVRAAEPLRLVRSTRDYFETLRKKLRWGGELIESAPQARATE